MFSLSHQLFMNQFGHNTYQMLANYIYNLSSGIIHIIGNKEFENN